MRLAHSRPDGFGPIRLCQSKTHQFRIELSWSSAAKESALRVERATAKVTRVRVRVARALRIFRRANARRRSRKMPLAAAKPTRVCAGAGRVLASTTAGEGEATATLLPRSRARTHRRLP